MTAANENARTIHRAVCDIYVATHTAAVFATERASDATTRAAIRSDIRAAIYAAIHDDPLFDVMDGTTAEATSRASWFLPPGHTIEVALADAIKHIAAGTHD
jgi:hypothetical protein